jgi:GT2 family glycosyltransferase
VIVVTWNRPELLRRCLGSIRRAAEVGGPSCEVWVVDNGSTAGDAGVVEAEFPEVRLIRCEDNLGFARANNLALRRASGRYYLLVNNDVLMPADALAQMLKFMESRPQVGVAGAMLVDVEGKQQPSSADVLTPGAALSEALLLAAILRRRKGQKAREDPGDDRPLGVGYVSGAFFMIRRDTVEQIGLLDERFDFYGEEMDWCARAHQAGWRVVTLPGVQVVHHHGATTQTDRRRFVGLRLEGRRRFLDKHYGRAAAWCYRAAAAIGGLLLLLRSMFPGGGRSRSQRAVDAFAGISWALTRKKLWPP